MSSLFTVLWLCSFMALSGVGLEPSVKSLERALATLEGMSAPLALAADSATLHRLLVPAGKK